MIYLREKVWRQIAKYSWVALTVVIAVLVLVSLTAPQDRMPFDSEDTTMLSEGWMWLAADGGSTPITLPTQLDVPVGQPVVIACVIPEHLEGPLVLCFRSAQQTVSVALNGEVIYSFGKHFSGPLGRSPGALWNLVRLPEGCGGGTVTISLTSYYTRYSGRVDQIREGTKASLVFYLLRTYIVAFSLAVLILLAGIAMLAVHLLLLRKNTDGRELLYLGTFAVLVSMWMLGESRMLQFFTGDLMLSLVITFVSMMACPIPVLKYICTFKDFRYQRLLKGIVTALYVQLAAVCILQLLNILDFFELLAVVHILLFVSISITIAALVTDYLRSRNRRMRSLVLSTTCLAVLTLAEILLMNISHGSFVGELVLLGVLIFIVAQVSLALRQANSILRLSRVASVDLLTGCKNRTAYSQRLLEQRELVGLTAVLGDLNNLKKINDTFGHEVGDDALIRCAHCFDDAFGSRGDCYRIGGDEFVFLGVNLDPDQLNVLMTEFELTCKRQQQQVAYPLEIALGSANFDPELDKDIHDTIARADSHMYINKRSSKSVTVTPPQAD